MRYIGDVHGKFRQYKNLIDSCTASIQLGDMGVGFYHETTGQASANPPYDHMVAGNHRFIRGNHDNPGVCKKHTQYIPDGHIESTPGGAVSMYIGGALSIDKPWRTPNFSWWEDEELNAKELNTFVDVYQSVKPDIMITHTCPENVASKLFANGEKLDFPSRTQQCFDSLFHLHQPKMWLFGHWHIHKDEVINDCRFICLAELQYLDLEV